MYLQAKGVIDVPKKPRNFRLEEDTNKKIQSLKELLQHGQLVPRKLTDTDVVEYAISELYRSFKQDGYDLR